MNRSTEVIYAADTIASWINCVSTEVEELSRDFAAGLERNLVGESKVDQTAFFGLDALIQEFLLRNKFAAGAGSFFAAEAVEEGSRTVEWWCRKESDAIDRLDFNKNPGSHRYYDYENQPFFSTPASTGEQTIWGPYIDYLGFEEYVLTFAAPFFIHGTFTGVTFCDIRIKDLEPLLMQNLRAIPGDAALINASNRVILGNSGMYLVGERVKANSLGQHRMALDVPHLGLSLIYTA